MGLGWRLQYGILDDGHCSAKATLSVATATATKKQRDIGDMVVSMNL